MCPPFLWGQRPREYYEHHLRRLPYDLCYGRHILWPWRPLSVDVCLWSFVNKKGLQAYDCILECDASTSFLSTLYHWSLLHPHVTAGCFDEFLLLQHHPPVHLLNSDVTVGNVLIREENVMEIMTVTMLLTKKIVVVCFFMFSSVCFNEVHWCVFRWRWSLVTLFS